MIWLLLSSFSFFSFSSHLLASVSFFSSFMLPLTFSISLSLTQSLSPTCPPSLTPSALFSLLYLLKLMEHITGLLKIALLQSQFIFFFILSFSLSLFPNAPIFSLFRTSLRREMSNGAKACQLIYQLAARAQLSMLSGLSG